MLKMHKNIWNAYTLPSFNDGFKDLFKTKCGNRKQMEWGPRVGVFTRKGNWRTGRYGKNSIFFEYEQISTLTEPEVKVQLCFGDKEAEARSV